MRDKYLPSPPSLPPSPPLLPPTFYLVLPSTNPSSNIYILCECQATAAAATAAATLLLLLLPCPEGAFLRGTSSSSSSSSPFSLLLSLSLSVVSLHTKPRITPSHLSALFQEGEHSATFDLESRNLAISVSTSFLGGKV